MTGDAVEIMDLWSRYPELAVDWDAARDDSTARSWRPWCSPCVRMIVASDVSGEGARTSAEASTVRPQLSDPALLASRHVVLNAGRAGRRRGCGARVRAPQRSRSSRLLVRALRLD